jgi:methyl-accepting chemotaxis protein
MEKFQNAKRTARSLEFIYKNLQWPEMCNFPIRRNLRENSRDLQASSRRHSLNSLNLRVSSRRHSPNSQNLRANSRDLRETSQDLRESSRRLRENSRDLRKNSQDLRENSRQWRASRELSTRTGEASFAAQRGRKLQRKASTNFLWRSELSFSRRPICSRLVCRICR